MGCNCQEAELERMERHYEEIVCGLNVKIGRLRQALRDAGLDLRTIMLLETSGTQPETVKA